jgi:hypothetical protein
LGRDALIPVAISTVIYMPLNRVVARHTHLATLTTVWNMVAVVIRKRAVEALTIIDDAVSIAVGGPFDKVRDGR